MDIDWLSLNEANNLVRILGVAIPILTALLTRTQASRALKAVVTLVASVLLGTLGYLVGADGGYDWGGFTNSFLNAFVPAIAAYYGLWKPTGVTASVSAATARFGLGNKPEAEPEQAEPEQAEPESGLF